MIFGGFTPFTAIDYPGKTACMVYTIGCNFRCPYCHNPELVDETVETHIDESVIMQFLEKRRGLLDGVVITGGEPTLHADDLRAFIERVKELGFKIKLDTNGTNPDFVAHVRARGLVDYIAMDIKAPRARYAALVGRPVDTEAIAQSVAEILRAPAYEFRTTVVKRLLSPDDIAVMAEEISGARYYFLQQFVPTKTLNPQFLRATTYSREELEALRERAAPYVQHCLLRI